VQIAKPTLYKQYKSTNLDDMSYAILQLKTMLRSPKILFKFQLIKEKLMEQYFND